MRTRVKLTLNEFESRQMLDAAPVLPPPGEPDAVQTAPAAEPAAPASDPSQATLAEYDRLLGFAATDTIATISSLDAALQTGGAFPGLTVTGVGAGLTPDGFGSASPQAVVLIAMQPTLGEAGGQAAQILVYRPDPGASDADTLYGIRDRLVRGAVGAGAGAATGAGTGAGIGFVGGIWGGPLAVVTTAGGAAAGAIGGTVVGGIYGVFFADDIKDAVVGGAIGGVGGGVAGTGVRAVVIARAAITAESAAAAAAATAARHNEIRQNIDNLYKFVLANAGSTNPLVQDQVATARLQAESFARIIAAEGGKP